MNKKLLFLTILTIFILMSLVYSWTVDSTVKSKPDNAYWLVNTSDTLFSGRQYINMNGAGVCNYSFIAAVTNNGSEMWDEVAISVYIDGVLNETNVACFNATECGIDLDFCQAYGNASSASAATYSWDVKQNYTSAFSTDSVGNWTFGLDFLDPFVTLSTPANATYYNTLTGINFTHTYDEKNIYICRLYSDYDCDGDLDIIETNETVTDSTEGTPITSTFFTTTTTFSECNSTIWNVECVDLAGRSSNATADYTIYFDTEEPVITGNLEKARGLDTVTNNSWTAFESNNFTFTVIDSNLDTCELWFNWTEVNGTIMNGTTTSDLLVLNDTRIGVVSGVLNGFSDVRLQDGVNYEFNIRCNDSSNNFGYLTGTSLSSSRSFNVDTTYPAEFSCSFPSNNSASNDLTPKFEWADSSDVNNIVYEFFYKDIDISDWSNINVSALNYYQFVTNMPTNWSGLHYQWYVNATDQAGNSINGSNCGDDGAGYMSYFPLSACNSLRAGWNICGSWQSGLVNTTYIADMAGATYVSHYNSSHDFVTYVNGSSTNAAENFTQGEPIFIYKPSAGTWEGNFMDAYTTAIYTAINLTNATSTSSNWNWITIESLNSLQLKQLEERVYATNFTSGPLPGDYLMDQDTQQNISIGYFAYFNNTNGRYYPFVTNETFNNGTLVQFGEAIALLARWDGLYIDVANRTAEKY